MRKAILSTLLAVIPAGILGFPANAQQAAADPGQQQERKADSTGVPASPKATTPNSGEASQTQSAAAPIKETDPSKLAASPVEKGGKLPGTAPVNDKTYIIGAEDVLRIVVWGEPRLSGEFMVRPDGKISMSLIGDIDATGKTPEQLNDIIAERLKAGDFMRQPNVNTGVAQVKSKKYYLNGEINKPGSYPLIVPTTILEALVEAGGFKDFANKKKIRILRMEEGSLKEYRFDYNAVTKGKHLEQNILLKPGDQVIVP
jgi:polysaccharide export outer membrane protein